MSDPIPASPITEFERPIPVFVAAPRRERYWVHILLLILTLFTTTVVGSHMQSNFQKGFSVFAEEEDSFAPFFPVADVFHHPSHLLLGLPFSLTLMAILMAHEMGHYLYCVRYNVSATLPFFIPFPSLIGTLGAFIRIRSPIRSRTALFDIGIAGPIAGFVIACLVLVFALPLSKLGVAVAASPPAYVELHYPLIFTLAHAALVKIGGLHGVSALPLGQLYLHPVAIAAWVGMFATALNLLPGGQLDGGHIVFSIAPRAHRFVSRLTILCLIPMAVYLWAGWLLWAVLLELSSMRHPQVADWPRVHGVRSWLAVFGALMLILTLTPAPFVQSSLKNVIQELRHH
jgi:membrane-associated protease RseP (regulator of RpoE activity)